MRRAFLFVCFMLTLVSSRVTTTRAEDWWQFRGPDGQGHSDAKNVPSEWDQKKNVAWSVPIEGEGWSSPVYHKGRLYLTAAVKQAPEDKPSFSLRAICLDAASGKTVWTTEALREDSGKSVPIHSKNSHASATPLVADGRLYVHFGHQGTACLDLSGRVVWQTQDLTYQPVHGNGGSPALFNDLLIFSCDGASDPFVAAIDRRKGQLKWRTPRDTTAEKNFSFSTPLVIDVRGKSQVISPGSNAVFAYEPMTGKEIWRVRYDGYSVIPRPIYGHGLIFISTGYNNPSVLAIRPDGQGDVTDTHIAWSTPRGAPHTPSLLLVGDELYMVSDHGAASCVDARTGSVNWNERLDGDFSASPVYAGGKIFFQNETGVGYVIRPGTTFELLATNDLAEPTLASYAIAENALFIRTGKNLYRIQE